MMMRQSPQFGQPAVVMTQLRQFFTVKDVALDAQVIEPDVQVLLVAHPQDLSERAAIRDRPVRHARRQAAAAGRPAFARARRAAPAPAASRRRDTASSLDRLLNAWGVEAPSDKVVLDLRGAWRVRANPGDRVQAVDYLAWFNLQGDSLNRDEVALGPARRR